MAVTTDDDVTERVGQFEMRVCFGEPTPESEARWNRRADVLAAWLIELWERRQREIAERN
ncbi:MAG: hypothetical protein BWX88_00475 [Planctomycetes bacterium ADurb.Bin126]|jgi:hypothetical protein|nr:MAG: hypothetical protein BWX88_00475 [Planctomycetes bacterium ADurb.Bin126]